MEILRSRFVAKDKDAKNCFGQSAPRKWNDEYTWKVSWEDQHRIVSKNQHRIV